MQWNHEAGLASWVLLLLLLLVQQPQLLLLLLLLLFLLVQALQEPQLPTFCEGGPRAASQQPQQC
jgi:hypothetical protein